MHGRFENGLQTHTFVHPLRGTAHSKQYLLLVSSLTFYIIRVQYILYMCVYCIYVVYILYANVHIRYVLKHTFTGHIYMVAVSICACVHTYYMYIIIYYSFAYYRAVFKNPLHSPHLNQFFFYNIKCGRFFFACSKWN